VLCALCVLCVCVLCVCVCVVCVVCVLCVCVMCVCVARCIAWKPALCAAWQPAHALNCRILKRSLPGAGRPAPDNGHVCRLLHCMAADTLHCTATCAHYELLPPETVTSRRQVPGAGSWSCVICCAAWQPAHTRHCRTLKRSRPGAGHPAPDHGHACATKQNTPHGGRKQLATTMFPLHALTAAPTSAQQLRALLQRPCATPRLTAGENTHPDSCMEGAPSLPCPSVAPGPRC
jgi:hypothetical protein